MQRKPFSQVKVKERIRFDNGYYMTGRITANVGTHNGKRMVWFANEETGKLQLVCYAAHRSVVPVECLCCDFGAHDMSCDCDGSTCCHPENH